MHSIEHLLRYHLFCFDSYHCLISGNDESVGPMWILYSRIQSCVGCIKYYIQSVRYKLLHFEFRGSEMVREKINLRVRNYIRVVLPKHRHVLLIHLILT